MTYNDGYSPFTDWFTHYLFIEWEHLEAEWESKIERDNREVTPAIAAARYLRRHKNHEVLL